MVKFEFTLEDVDAENMIACLREEEWKMRDTATEVDGDAAEWYQSRADYMRDLCDKIAKSSTRVG